MAAQESRNLSMYRISVAVGGDVVVRHERGWNGKDAMQRLSQRLRGEGHTLYTMSILDSKEIQ